MILAELVVSVSIYVILTFIFLWGMYTLLREESLTDSEIEDFGDIMMGFHADPDYDDFMEIWNARTKLIARRGKPIKFWIWGVYQKQPHFFKPVQRKELESWMREIQRGIRRMRAPNSELLDCMWSLYFATGEQEYPELIRSIAQTSDKFEVREAARLSYRDIMGVEAKTIESTENTENAEITENTEKTETL